MLPLGIDLADKLCQRHVLELAISLRLTQNASSRLTLVLRSPMTTERFFTAPLCAFPTFSPTLCSRRLHARLPVVERTVAAFVDSIRKIGLINPIIVFRSV